MSDADWVDLALAVARVWMGGMMFAHGYRHVESVRSGPGMADWFESLGLKNGPLQAWSVTITELVFGAMLVIGLLTPLAYAGTASIVLVALVTAHRNNGFFINNPGQGWEYVATIAVLSIALGGVGPGSWSVDDALELDFVFEPSTALPLTAAVAIGGTVLFLGTFWRPPASSDD
ncbi:MAG: doxX subfamily protein [Acidimicrobiales bacterium]|nr:MAG: doxX subfamily protein [Acidimicrobiales bacterium]